MATQAAFKDPLAKSTRIDTTDLSVTKLSSPVCALARDCVRRYQDLYDVLRETTPYQAANNSFDRDAVLDTIQGARARFKAWATNIAALQESHLKSSLDSRLQQATEIRQRVLKILEDLKESLTGAFSIVTGTQVNETWEVGALSDSDEDEENSPAEDVVQTSELAELLSATKTATSSLMEISIVIRNTPARDDYTKAAARHSLDPWWDIAHVHEKFGPAKRNSDWLIQRLGKSITRRRQYLIYRKEHHGKLTRDWSELPEESVDGEVNEIKPENTIAFTKATTFIEAKPSAQKDSSEVHSFGSQTSYEQTVVGETVEHRLTVPGPPIEAFEGVPFEFGKPFQCPYCYTEQSVKTRNAWKKHVFRDLRPYVCTFAACGLRMFKSRNEWFAHELQNHRREWRCLSCGMSCSTKSSFKTHLQSHNPSLVGSELEALVLQSEEPMDRFPASACSLCDDWEKQIINPQRNERRAFLNDGKDLKPYGTLSQFRRHLGRHMEQLALFALPRNHSDELDDGIDEEAARDASSDSSESEKGILQINPMSDNHDLETKPLFRGSDPAQDDVQAKNKVDNIKNSPEFGTPSPIEPVFDNNLQIEKEEIVRIHNMETDILRNEVNDLTNHIRGLGGTLMAPIPTSSDFSINYDSINSLTKEEIMRKHKLEIADFRLKTSALRDEIQRVTDGTPKIDEPEPLPEFKPVEDGEWADFGTKKDKKKKGKSVVDQPLKIDEPAEDDIWAFGTTKDKKKKGKSAVDEPLKIDEPGPLPEIEPAEDDPWGGWGAPVSKKDKKKKKGAIVIEETPKIEEPEPLPDIIPVEDDPWGGWGAPVSKKDKKKKKGAIVIEETLETEDGIRNPVENSKEETPSDSHGAPCDTLYVGNLPLHADEEEVKELFSKQRGYRRLVFRTKQNGPMFFVQFEDTPSATASLHELDNYRLRSATKGFRLSYSKNPLGVRAGQEIPLPGESSPSIIMAAEMQRASMAEQFGRSEAGKALSDFTSRDDFNNAIQKSMDHQMESAADLIKSAQS